MQPTLPMRLATGPTSSSLLRLTAGGATLVLLSFLSVPLGWGPEILFYPMAMIMGAALSPLSARHTCLLVGASLLLRFTYAQWLPHMVVFDDERTYRVMAADILGAYLDGGVSDWKDNAWGHVSALLLLLYEDSARAAKALNALLGVVSAFLAAHIARRVAQDERIVHLTLLGGLFLPPLLFLSASSLKEQCVAFLLVLIAYGGVQRTASGWLLAWLGLGLLQAFRYNLAIVVIPVMAVLCALDLSRMWTTSVKARILVFGALMLTLEVGVTAIAHTRHVAQNPTIMVLTGLDYRCKPQVSHNRSTFMQYLDKDNLFAPSNLVLAPIRTLYSPSPLTLLKSPHAKTIHESLAISAFLYVAMPFVLISAAMALRQFELGLVVCVYGPVFLTAAYSALSNAPEIFRFHWAGFPLFFLLAFQGWRHRHHWASRAVVGAWWVSVGAFGIVYLR